MSEGFWATLGVLLIVALCLATGACIGLLGDALALHPAAAGGAASVVAAVLVASVFVGND